MVKSILQNEKVCYITGSRYCLERHHIYFGPNRKVSEANGFWIWLVRELHTGTNFAVHGKNGYELDMRLKRECQAKFEESHSRDEFMALIGRNYLD